MGRRWHHTGSTLAILGLLAGTGCSRPAPPSAAESSRPAAAETARRGGGRSSAPAPGDSPAAAVATTTPDPKGAAQPSTAAHPDQADRPVLRDFDARVKEYVALHKKLEDSLPKLPKDAHARAD